MSIKIDHNDVSGSQSNYCVALHCPVRNFFCSFHRLEDPLTDTKRHFL